MIKSKETNKKTSSIKKRTKDNKIVKSKSATNTNKTTKARGKKRLIEAFLNKDFVFTECSNEARLLFDKSRYGAMLDDGRVQLTLIEAYYLIEKEKIVLLKNTNTKKEISKETFANKCFRLEKNFWTRFAIFADFRNRGYVIKTALKFGADFRVYDKGINPGEDHARWIVYPVKETEVLTWYEFAAKNRVAHSTKKRLMLGIVDEENSVTYYEIKWTRP